MNTEPDSAYQRTPGPIPEITLKTAWYKRKHGYQTMREIAESVHQDKYVLIAAMEKWAKENQKEWSEI